MTTNNTLNLKSLLDDNLQGLDVFLSQQPNLSFEEVYTACFLNKKKCFSNELFWKSKLPLNYCREFLNSYCKIEFLDKYLSKDGHCNHSFNQKLFDIAPRLFKKMIKLKRIYQRSSFMESLKKMAIDLNNIKLNGLFNELLKIQELESNLIKNTKLDFEKLLEIPFDKLLFGFTRYNYEVNSQKDKEDEDKRDIIVSHETAVLEILNDVLNTNNKKWLKEGYYKTIDFEKFKNDWHNTIRNTEGGEYSECETVIYEVINNEIKRKKLHYGIEAYLSGMANFNFSDTDSPFTLNEEHRRFRKNNYKKQFVELYFTDEKELGDIEFRLSPKLFKRHMEFLNLPEKVTIENIEIDLSLIVEFLQYFSFENNKLEEISIFNWEELLNQFSELFKIEKSVFEKYLNHVTTDLGNSNNVELLNAPFIKINNSVIWIASLMRKRDWKTIWMNRLKTWNKIEKPTKNEINTNRESAVKRIFKNAGYKTKESIQLWSLEKKVGDIDVLAYKNGTMFIVEVKSSQITDEVITSQITETIKLEGVAAEQLQKIKTFLTDNENWNWIKKETGIQTNKNFEDIDVHYLIVTDYFEGDSKVYKDNYRKISIWELDVILKNNKKSLLNNFFVKAIMAMNGIEHKSSIDYDLWKGKKTINPAEIMKCIEENRVWKELDDIKQF